MSEDKTELSGGKQRDLELGVVLIGIAVCLLALALLLKSIPGPVGTGLSALMLALYLYHVGLLFLLSYWHEDRSFLFRWLMWLCERLSQPPGRGMVFFYAGLFFVCGTLVLFGVMRL